MKHRVDIKRDLEIRNQWMEVPHECDPDCPGEQNRRKLAVFDELLETAMVVANDDGRLGVAGLWNKIYRLNDVLMKIKGVDHVSEIKN